MNYSKTKGYVTELFYIKHLKYFMQITQVDHRNKLYKLVHKLTRYMFGRRMDYEIL